jgi:hypothetical protein
MKLILKLLCLGLLGLFSSQLAQATSAATGPLPDETYVAKAERLASNPAVRALAVDADKLLEYWEDFANTVNIVPPGIGLKCWQDRCRLEFIKNVIALHIKITDALLALPYEMRHDDLIVEMSISYTNILCPIFCKNWFEFYSAPPEHCPLISLMLRLHYVVCSFLFAVNPDVLIQNFNKEQTIRLADGLEPFIKGDGALKTLTELEAFCPKVYFEHWYGGAAFVAPESDGGECAAGEEHAESAEEEERAEGAE